VIGETLLIPGFSYLSRDLFRAAMTGGAESKEVASYLDSILEFARAGRGNAEEDGFENLKAAGRYQTTEAEILRSFTPSVSGRLSEKRGLELVRETCDELEEQVASLRHRKATKVGTNGD
jgi:hypothetical protein